MLKSLKIENYKSIDRLKIDLGQINVFIGDSGSGKSNILEAINLAAAAANNRLDNSYLVSRGIRVVEPHLMKSAFKKENAIKAISIYLDANDKYQFKCNLINGSDPYPKWINEIPVPVLDDHIRKFMTYTPSIKSLQSFEKEGQIYPIGINGEGLFKFLRLCEEQPFREIKEKIKTVGWQCDYPVNCLKDRDPKNKQLEIDLSCFTCKVPSEAHLFLWFYFSLFVSDLTPKFFAVEQINNYLNPRLCRRLTQELIGLAKKYDKQVIFTTNNPAVLDGLDLSDDTQRLFVVSRNQLGHSKARRILMPKPLEQQEPVQLSEAFLRGYLGGLSKNF